MHQHLNINIFNRKRSHNIVKQLKDQMVTTFSHINLFT